MVGDPEAEIRPIIPEKNHGEPQAPDTRRAQYALAILFALLLVAAAIYGYSHDSGSDGVVLSGAFAAQLLAQLFNLYVTRNLLREHDRLHQENNSK